MSNDLPINPGSSDFATEVLFESTKEDLNTFIEQANRKLQSYEPEAAAHYFRKAAKKADRLVELADLPKKQQTFADAAETYREHATALEQHGMDAVVSHGTSRTGTPGVNPTDSAAGPTGRDERASSEAKSGGPHDEAAQPHEGPRVQDELSFSLEAPDFDLSDVGGMHDLKQDLRDDIEEPIRRKELHEAYGIAPTRGVILQGPPGTGKTYLTRAFAGELGWNFIELSPAQVVSALVGEGARNIQQVFDTAKDNQPCIIFFDEIDNIAKDRTSLTQRSQSEEAMLTQLLTEMTSLGDADVIVFAATNKPEEVDQAVFNSERFQMVVEVPRPDAQARAEILRVHLRKRQVPVTGVDYEEVAQMTEGFSAADMKNVARNAAQQALEDVKESTADEIVPIQHQHVVAGVEQRRESVADQGKGGYLEEKGPFGGAGDQSDTEWSQEQHNTTGGDAATDNQTSTTDGDDR